MSASGAVSGSAIAITARGVKDYQKAVEKWDEQRVADFVGKECNFPQYAEAFIDNGVSGKELGLLTKQDMIDIGVITIGHRIRLLNKFKPFQAAAAATKRLAGISKWDEFVWPCDCIHWCFPRKFKLTQSGLKVTQDWCCTGEENIIDLNLIKDVKYTKTCCHCNILVLSEDGSATPTLSFNIFNHRAGKDIYKSLYAAKEGNQVRMAGSRPSK